MSNRRMFSNRIANSAKFLQMPFEAQLFYFHMVLKADDDGVVEVYPLTKMLGIPPDNLKVLLAKEYIQQLNEDQVMIIVDWLEHNKIRADRKVDSMYKELIPAEVNLLQAKPRSDVKDNSKRIGGPSTDGISQVKLGKVKLSKVNTYTSDFENFWINYPKKVEKPKAFTEWKKIKPNKDLQEKINNGVNSWIKSQQWQNKRYIIYPARFLKNRRWEDEVEQAVIKKGSNFLQAKKGKYENIKSIN